jgi:hypothetical protein
MVRVHRRMLPVTDKPLKAHASFHLNLSHPDRYGVWQKLRRNANVVFEPRRIPPELLWIHHVCYAFEICPRGNGLDCHRTWEALLLRSIPIVRTSTLDPLYEGFPVVIISTGKRSHPRPWRSGESGTRTASRRQCSSA